MKYWVSVQNINLCRCPEWKGRNYKNLDAAVRFAQKYAQRKDVAGVWVKNGRNQIVLTIK